MGQGPEGRIQIREHFIVIPSTTMSTGGGVASGQGLIYGNVNDGSFAATIDEPGGILAVTTNTSEDDSCAIYTEGKYKPADGGIVMEVRLKITDITTGAMFIGFSETMNKASPVMPLEFASTTMAYNGSGGIAGLVWDKDATTNDWRAGAGDGGIVATNADADGTEAITSGLGLSAAVNDRWDVVRVEIDPTGRADIYLAQDLGGFKLLKSIKGAVTPGDLFYAVVMCEARTSAAITMEIDYFNLDANIDWAQS